MGGDGSHPDNMSIRFACDSCDQHVEADLTMVGESIDCPRCGRRLTVPSGSTLPSSPVRPLRDVIFDCPRCGQNLVVDAAGAGQTIPCPKCQQSIVIPEASSFAASVGEESPALIRFPCPRCQQPLSVDAAKAGKHKVCPQCDRIITVPRPAAPPERV